MPHELLAWQGRAEYRTALALRMSPPGCPAHYCGRPPTSGQGASLSIEDAVTLAQCLRDLPGHEQAFARFETLRRPRVEQIVKAAVRINSSKVAGPAARRVRDTILPLVFMFAADS
jgi:2-polyprenyl-6-methoxyphenol hydroxylase-like FAD-dependent oxidoreductase